MGKRKSIFSPEKMLFFLRSVELALTSQPSNVYWLGASGLGKGVDQ